MRTIWLTALSLLMPTAAQVKPSSPDTSRQYLPVDKAYIWRMPYKGAPYPEHMDRLVVPVASAHYEEVCVANTHLEWRENGMWHTAARGPGKGGIIDGEPNLSRCDLATCEKRDSVIVLLVHMEEISPYEWQSHAISAQVRISKAAWKDSACSIPLTLHFTVDTRTLPHHPNIQ